MSDSSDSEMTSPVDKEATASVELPEHVVERIESRLPYTNFETVDQYAAAALQGLVRELDDTPADVSTREVDSDADAEAVRDRLSSLGYL